MADTPTIPPSPSVAGPSRLYWGTLGVCAGVLVVLTLSRPWTFGSDDSIFYIVIARNILDGRGISFNGLIPTNGVQPLWQIMVTASVGALRLVGVESPTGITRGLFVVNWAFIGAALHQTWRLFGDLDVREPYRRAGLVVVAATLSGPFGLFGSEGHLTALLVIVLLRSMASLLGADEIALTRSLRFGVIGGLLCLSRLDTIWFVAAAFAIVLAPIGRRPTVRRTLQTATGGVATVAVLAPYLIWNLTEFGHLMPVSGALKVDTSSPGFDLGAAGSLSIASMAVIWLLGGISIVDRQSAPLLRRAWLSCAIGSTLSSCWYVVFSKGRSTHFAWYLIVHFVGLALAVTIAAFAAGRLLQRADRSARLVPGLISLGGAGIALLAVPYCYFNVAEGSPKQSWHDLRTFSTEVSARVPAGDRIATVDFPGILGLTAEQQRIIPLDGLAGDFDFQISLRDLGIECTLGRLDVRWLVTEDAVPAVPDPDSGTATFAYSSWQFNEVPSTMDIDLASDQQLTAGRRGYRLWRIDPKC